MLFLNPPPSPSLMAKGGGNPLYVNNILPFPHCLREGVGGRVKTMAGLDDIVN